MPRPPRGPYLWLRPPERDDAGAVAKPARWIIKDRRRQTGTGCGAGDYEEAERKLAAYIAEKHAPARRERHLSEIPVGDVVNIYLADVVPGQARPEKAIERAGRLLDYFGEMTLDQITGATCRAYADSRLGKGKSNKGTGGGARRDLQDLGAAISHHARQGLHRGNVLVTLPKRGKARQRWLTRSEAARLIWTCRTTREVQGGKPTDKRPLAHLVRFLLLGIYTGSRPGAILNAAWFEGPGLSYIDLERGVFHRHGDGECETDKRQPTVRLTPFLIKQLRRWSREDEKKKPRPVFVVTFCGEQIGSVKTALTTACTLAKLETKITAYTLRHTAASWLVSKGISTRKVAEFIGTSEAMIIANYGHLAPEYQDEAVRAISRK